MKIYCEKCGSDLSSYVDKKIISFSVGKLTCPNCKKKQSRYISSTDLNFFFGATELVYLFFLLITALIYDYTNLSYYTLLVLIIPFFLLLLCIINISRYVYIKAPFKNEFKHIEFVENEKDITKWFSYRAIVFGALSMCVLSNEDIKYYAIITLAITLILTIIKFISRLNYEKKIAKHKA